MSGVEVLEQILVALIRHCLHAPQRSWYPVGESRFASRIHREFRAPWANRKSLQSTDVVRRVTSVFEHQRHLPRRGIEEHPVSTRVLPPGQMCVLHDSWRGTESTQNLAVQDLACQAGRWSGTHHISGGPLSAEHTIRAPGNGCGKPP